MLVPPHNKQVIIPTLELILIFYSEFWTSSFILSNLSFLNSEDGKGFSVYFNFLVLLSTNVKTVCSQNINKKNVNIADETLTDYSFLSRCHYPKSKNYLKRRYRIRHCMNSHVYWDTL